MKVEINPPSIKFAGFIGGPHGTEADVCQDITKRQELGLNKYGVSIRKNNLNLKEWMTHAYQECLDQAIYLKRAIEEIDKMDKR